MQIRTIIVGVLLIASWACSWDNEEELFSVEFCDTVDISFPAEIVPLLSTHCWACHSNQNAVSFGAGLALEDYEDIRASSRRILGAIRHEEGYSPMPKNTPKLDSCLILVYESWYNDGSRQY